jgi:hypothetical protein
MITAPGVNEFIDLSDAPHSYAGQATKVVKVNAGETAVEFGVGAGGATAFTDLSDVPATYAGANGNFVKVNATATGLEFVAGGGGSFTVTETEVDFGTNPVVEKTFTIVDALVSATSKIMVTESGSIATGRIAGGDSLWDSIVYSCVPASGSFTLYARASGSVVGYRKLFYTFS